MWGCTDWWQFKVWVFFVFVFVLFLFFYGYLRWGFFSHSCRWVLYLTVVVVVVVFLDRCFVCFLFVFIFFCGCCVCLFFNCAYVCVHAHVCAWMVCVCVWMLYVCVYICTTFSWYKNLLFSYKQFVDRVSLSGITSSSLYECYTNAVIASLESYCNCFLMSYMHFV